MPGILFFLANGSLNRYAHKKKVKHRYSGTENVAEQHGIIPFAYRKEHRLHDSAENKHPSADIKRFFDNDAVYFVFVFDMNHLFIIVAKYNNIL